MMLKENTTKIYVAVGVALCILLMGTALAVRKGTGDGQPSTNFAQGLASESKSSAALQLALQQPQSDRVSKLEAIANGWKSLERSRARYLLATELIQQNQGQQALKWLEGLEQEYTVLAPHILLKRAIAYELTGDTGKAQGTWEELLKKYPKSPVAAEALYALDKKDPKYGEQAIAAFPGHPRTVEIVQQRLKQNPNQPQLLLLLAKYGIHLTEYGSVLEQLVNEYGSQLTPADWEVIAFGYREKQDYAKSGAAYTKATPTPRNAYRAGRGLWLGHKVAASREAYKKLVQEFPDSKETGLGLLRLSRLVDQKEAATYLDQIIRRFPDWAGEALVDKAKILEALGSTKSGKQARQSVLSQHSKSQAAAEMRWKLAKQHAAAGDYEGAWYWATQLGNENPDSDLAPKAGYWVGQWARRLGREQEAKKAFEYVLYKYPESYYAWRSAVFLGWNVGDFTTVRQLAPASVVPLQRSAPPAGSDALKELHQLGQDLDAWTLWQVEFTNRMDPTVAEQYTDGVIRMGVGDSLDGIYMLSSLAERETPEERSQYQALRQQLAYWHALYPFPYWDSIVKWSGERQLNPFLVTALIRQESRFMPGIRSSVNATGLMQVMPDTAKWMAETINLKKYNLENPDDNINLGTKFLYVTHQEYKNNSLLAVASYNAGPGNVGDWIKRFGFSDPDEFIEKIPFPETRGYVEYVFENYWNYLRLYNPAVYELLAQHSGSSFQPTALRQ